MSSRAGHSEVPDELHCLRADYTRISLLLENLAQKGQEALLDLNQEIAELNVLKELKKKQEEELLKKS